MNDVFDKLKVTKNGETFYLEKSVDIGTYKNITLTLESVDKQSTNNQINLYKLITQNFELICQSAKQAYLEEYKIDLFKKFEIDSIFIPDIDNNTTDWELWLVMKGRFENCVLSFNKLTPSNISFSA